MDLTAFFLLSVSEWMDGNLKRTTNAIRLSGLG